MALFEDPAPQGNQPEFTVSELSGAVKRGIEGEFGLVRLRGEVGRVSRPEFTPSGPHGQQASKGQGAGVCGNVADSVSRQRAT